MKLPLETPPLPRRVSLIDRILHLTDRKGRRTSAENAAIGVLAVGDAAARSSAVGTESPSPEPQLYLEARQHIKRRAWGHAQRALENVARQEPDSSAPLDLASVRTIRRALRRTARWPSDVEAHLDLGRACFDLDLGEDALAEFVLV